MTWDVDGGGRLAGIGEEASLASLQRLSRSMPDLAELRALRHRNYEVRFTSPVSPISVSSPQPERFALPDNVRAMPCLPA